MLGMNKLQLRYFRNVLTAWVVLVFIYLCFYWMIPLSYALTNLAFGVGAVVYGVLFFK